MVSVGGLASGLDTTSIINQLIELERRPIAGLQADIAELQQVQAKFSGLSTDFSSLSAAASSLSFDTLSTPSVSISDAAGAAFSVSADASAATGSHDLTVSRLATAHRLGSQGFATASSTPVSSSAGTFAIRVGNSGGLVSISVTTSTSLNDLAASINAADGDIAASVVNDGTNSLSSRLVLTSKQTGEDNEIQIVSNGTDLDFTNTSIEATVEDSDNAGTYSGILTASGTYAGDTSKTYIVDIVSGGAAGTATYRVSSDGGQSWSSTSTTPLVATDIDGNSEGVDIAFSAGGTLTVGDRFYVDVTNPVLTAAQDSVFTLNGITQTRASNTINDAIEGVTIELASTVSSTSFSISQDTSQIVAAVESFVEAYNTVFAAVRNEQTFDSDTLEAGLLLGDRTANTILSQLRNAVSTQLTENVTSYDSLASLGIVSSRTGGLSLNSTQLQNAINSDLPSVLAVLGSTESASSSLLSVSGRPEQRADGEYAVNISTVPEVAAFVAGSAQTDTLSANETLSFTYSSNHTEDSPTFSSFSVTLQSGDNLAQVIDRLNSAFATQGVALTAFSSTDTLNIQTTEYGADQFFSVVSDVASGANTSRIDTTVSSDTGVDIAGTIGGQSATGAGNRLEVNETETLDDLAITFTGISTGLAGSITISTGIGTVFSDLVADLSSGSGSVIGARSSSIQDEIDALEQRIIDREEQVARTQTRLEEQFAALEVQLAGLQSQSDFLSNQLAALSNVGGEGS